MYINNTFSAKSQFANESFFEFTVYYSKYACVRDPYKSRSSLVQVVVVLELMKRGGQTFAHVVTTHTKRTTFPVLRYVKCHYNDCDNLSDYRMMDAEDDDVHVIPIIIVFIVY